MLLLAIALWQLDPNRVAVGLALLALLATVLVVLSCGQRRREERVLGDSEALKSAILSSFPAHIAVLDRDGVIIAVNEAWTTFAQHNDVADMATVAIGVDYLSVCAEAARVGAPGASDAHAAIAAVCEGQRHETIELEYECDAPEVARWFTMKVTPLRREAGGAVIIHREITKAKQNEMQLRESEQRFRTLADALPLAIWMTDEWGHCTYVNRAFLLTAWVTDGAVTVDRWLQLLHPEDRDRCGQTYLNAIAKRASFSMEYRLPWADGTWHWRLSSGAPYYGIDGRFLGLVGGCIDITERRAAERVLQDFGGRLLAAQEEERRRIARELHDNLNQRVALLSIEIEQLAIACSDSSTTLTRRLRTLGTRAGELSSEIHALSHRLHSSKLDALGLGPAVRALCQEVGAQGVEVRFSETNMPGSVPHDVALCLFRIAQESLTNIVKHSGARHAEVSLVATGESLVLRITDPGRGFDLAAASNGGGLGLVGMRERLRSNGGELNIRSRPSIGTTVEARLPIALAIEPRTASSVRVA